MPNVRKSFISALIKKLMTRLTPKYLLILTSYYIQLKHNMLKNKDMVINWSYMNKSIKNPLIKGTIILTAAGLFCRILGFYSRIFLNRHIGAYGMGILQLIMPLCGNSHFRYASSVLIHHIKVYSRLSQKPQTAYIRNMRIPSGFYSIFDIVLYICRYNSQTYYVKCLLCQSYKGYRAWNSSVSPAQLYMRILLWLQINRHTRHIPDY